MLVMQAVGGLRGYLCECGGQWTVTQVDHCHGPHSLDCHTHQSDVPHHDNQNSDDRQDHQRIVQELQLRSVEGLQVPVVIPVLLNWMPAVLEPTRVADGGKVLAVSL